ncbi:MBL fold metallo-hydrolase [Allokutzneria multivorans]|uniref:MBL fold metallo-hydrolase n=1 Tax=Allokutzneria multivorans TaxID=1142134 RepID=UPI0031E600A2
MFVAGFPVGALQANCFLLAPAEGADCVIVDPGQDAVEPIEEALREHRLTPAAVLLTHGHFDHVFSAAELCRAHGVPVWIHPEDRPMLADPGRALGPAATALFGGRVEMSEPDEVRELAADQVLEVAGLSFTVDHTPGHTRGSVCFRTTTEEGGRLLFSGDTLFAGSIGRTDLPGGDTEEIMRSLKEKILPLPDDTVVLPGHGPASTIGRERATNPFLSGGGASFPTRGL